MASSDTRFVTLAEMQEAWTYIKKSPYCVCTPILEDVAPLFDVEKSIKLYIKLENMQTTGSFKLRGVTNQLRYLPTGCGTEASKLISMSAGNYGKTFAFLCQKMGLKAKVLMPETAPINRASVMEGYGCAVERAPNASLMTLADGYVKSHNMTFLHPFDDLHVIAGYGSVSFEILERVADPDIVLVNCGGGGLLSGIAGALKLTPSSSKCRVYGVEPEGACTMHESFKAGRAVDMSVKSVASGLSPTFAGRNTYAHCRKYVDDILLVSDEEILRAMFVLYERGIKAEPSASAAFAALLYNKVPDVVGKKVVVVVTGGNVTPHEYCQYEEMLKK